jgi:hypothetical protein
MTHWTEAADLIDDREYAAQGLLARYAPGVLAFTLSAALGVYIVYLRPFLRAPAPPPPAQVAGQGAGQGAAQVARSASNANPAPVAKTDPFGGLVPVVPAPSLALPAKPANPFGALVVNGFGASDRFAAVEPPRPPEPPADLRAPAEESAPLPPPRPSALARVEPTPAEPASQAEASPQVAGQAPKPAPTPGLFQKLFGGVPSDTQSAPSGAQLAYAAPPPASNVSSALASRAGIGAPGAPGGAHGFFGGLGLSANPTSRFGDHVAVYDISARVVYLPDGTKIEAHSGLGPARDDPSKVNERMRGPTPPATYALSPREQLFHGVAALRLTPIDSNVFGRAGLLAHTYMLGPDGDSNGCISFRDYDAFLRAYRSGEITKLVVVTRL